MLLYSQPNTEATFNFVAAAAVAGPFEVQPLLTAIWAYALHINRQSEEAKSLCSLVT